MRGIDDREVQPHRESKSVGAEDTFPFDLTTIDDMFFELDKIASIVHDRVYRHGLKGRTITLKIKYHDFKLATRSRSFAQPVIDPEQIVATAKELLMNTDPEGKKIRLLGISLSNFNETSARQKSDDDTDQLNLGL